MIAEMKKISLVSLEAYRSETLRRLRDLGLVHLHEVRGQSELLEELLRRKSLIDNALMILPEDEDKDVEKELKKGIDEKKIEESLEIARRIEKQKEDLHSRHESIDRLRREMERTAPLGDIDPADFELLRQKGLDLRLFRVTRDKKDKFPAELTTFVVHSAKNSTIVLIEYPEDPETQEMLTGFETIELPAESPSSMQKRIASDREAVEHIEDELRSLCKYRPLLRASSEMLSRDIEFEKVRAGLLQEGSLVYLSGFVPTKKIELLRRAAKENGWGLLIRDPEEGDPIPTLVENPKPIRIIKPVFDFLGTVPGYYEYDISFFFLLFFTLFFAMIVGDAGYGVLLLGTSLYSAVKTKKARGRITSVHSLMIVMGTATMIWGAVTGVWFGSVTLSQQPFFSWMIIDSIYGFGGPETQESVKYLCFIIGTVHLSIAHIWNFLSGWKRGNKLQAVSQLGWLSMVLGLYYLVLFLVLDPEKYPVPGFSLVMVGVGLVLVLFLSEQEGNFFKGVLKGLANFMPKALDSISAFSDIISYIRLFAVGLATVEIAKSFNSMAAELGNSVLGIVGGIVILLIGHGLNMAMAALSVVVHGVRLNVLEFSGHLGMEWTGIPYDPFRDRFTKE
jgi:V/A-type H+-transporting ATPase subunit I